MLAPIYGIGIGPFGSMTDFSTLKNRAPPSVIANEYIVAPADYTPARMNEYPKEYSVAADVLSEKIEQVVLRQPRITRIAVDPNTKRQEYVQRSLIFRFPDVITLQAIPLGPQASTLAVHSYSIYGAGDLGVNANRVKTWIDEINDEVKTVSETRKFKEYVLQDMQ